VPPVVKSARRYKCGQVQSAQEYIMYLDTDGSYYTAAMTTNSQLL